MAKGSKYTSRFSDAPWLVDDKSNLNITVGGAGGIGSWLLLFLSRTANYNRVYLYEMDDIDETNMAGQFFKPAQVGMTKAQAISSNMQEFSAVSGVDSLGRLEKTSPVSRICFSCFDNMEARKNMFEDWKESVRNTNEEAHAIFIDGRMIMEDGQVYAVTRNKGIVEYEKTLFDDGDIKGEACSLKATTHSGAHIASVMLSIYNNYLANFYHYKDYVREVPFSYVYSLVPMSFEVKF